MCINHSGEYFPFIFFVNSENIATFAMSYPSESSKWVKVGWTCIHKGVTVRFGFDAIRTSQIPCVCQKQSNGNVS